MHCALLAKVHAMLVDPGPPKTYLSDALEYAAFIHNLSPTRALENMTPAEAWSGNKPDVSRLRVFGSRIFVHLPDKVRSKLRAKSLICTFLSNTRHRSAYKVVHQPPRPSL